MLINAGEYFETIEQIKEEIRAAQYQATLQVNKELTLLYHSVGTVINEHKAWGNKFVDNLAKDIKLAFPNTTGFSARNLKYMAKYALAYPDRKFVQTVSAQIPWSHNIAILIFTFSLFTIDYSPLTNAADALLRVSVFYSETV